MVEPEASLIRQYEALLAAEKVTLVFEDAAIDRLADLAEAVNKSVENIGARRLSTVLEKLPRDGLVGKKIEALGAFPHEVVVAALLLMPLAFGSILGGLVTSTLLNLFIVPALYLRFGRNLIQ